MASDEIIINVPQKKRSFWPGLIFLGLCLTWFVVGMALACNEYRIIKEGQRAAQEQQQLKLERQRRQAARERELLEEKAVRSGVQNAIDGVKR